LKAANIYIDEFGNSHLDLSKSGTFSHFVYTSVVLDKTNVSKARDVRETICRNFRLGPNLKSSNIKDKQFYKRINILMELIDTLDFSIDVLVIDKSKIDSEGLKQKRTFYKYFQSLFVSKYNDRFDTYYIWADAVGTDFRKELQNYVNTKGVQRDLFNPDRSFQLTDDKNEEKLVQLADFISGCVGKIFCTSHAHSQAREIYNLLHSRVSVDYFPFESSRPFVTGKADDIIDHEIRKMNLLSIEKYYQRTNTNPEKSRLLDYLRLQSEINPERLVPTHDILMYLQHFFPSYTTEKLRTLVRDLRYDGLFIVSHAGKPGYKLANSYQDIYEHFNHFLKYVIPMLQKVQILNETISSHSFNKINPIEKDENMVKLKELLSGMG
jgi:hypothetical protein